VKRFLTAPAAALALLLTLAAGLQASPIPPDKIAWTYNWQPGAPALTADGNPSAGVTFTNEPPKVAVGSSDIVATNLRVFSAATAAEPDKITGSNGDYKLSLTLKANDGGQTATLNFLGNLKGAFSAENANLKNKFTATTTQIVDLGSFRFTVALMAYTPPGPPDQANAGSISAYVQVENIQPNNIPEPSALVLSGMGLTFLGGACVRRLREKSRSTMTTNPAAA